MRCYFKINSVGLCKIINPPKKNKYNDEVEKKVLTSEVMFFYEHDGPAHELGKNIHYFKITLFISRIDQLEDGSVIYNFKFRDNLMIGNGKPGLKEKDINFQAKIIDNTPYDRIFETTLNQKQEEVFQRFKPAKY